MKKICITGALGHIGSHVLRHAAGRFPGAEITLFDNLSTQRFPVLFDLPEGGTYRFVEGDVREYDFAPLISDVDVVLHLAAITDATSSFDNRDVVETVNLGGTRRVGEACAAAGVPLIALSSTSVYGTQNAVVAEDCSEDELKPQSPYAESKIAEETLLSELAQSHGLRHVVCRFGTIFGVSPGMRFHTAVNRFCWQAVMGQPLSVWRTALDQKRPYLDLVDAGNALAFIIERELFDGRIYNVLTVNATVRDVVDEIRNVIPETAVELVDTRIMNQLSYEVSVERFRSLGFEFEGSLRRAVRDTIALLHKANSAETHAIFS